MSPKNYFKDLSTSNNANVVNQEKYEKILSLYSGFLPDNVPTHLLNKVLRRSSTTVSVVDNFIMTQSGDSVLNDSDIVKLNIQLNRELEQKIITKISNYALKKSQNVADIPNKNVLVKNRSLLEKLIPVGAPPL
ncbi:MULTISPECIES: hypothetical protein [Photorhabdus]|uniref:Photorhabdus luminescens subsp. laumondii TTO1 complete genome segment 12/17 n=1 Tax=Photorhabdus laumondii subsp. laumondii (strain DSM 15139 / CIP 105565 / TT01) TaxID=243265 RepID=Q7N1Y9_PHOLL|nr:MULTISPECIES: hypothetical protein [Photorhabdus]AWK43006.1 hypothetical protein A4R40_16585 [Photorhabdus laumondii subsp. laumondii]MCC8390556.1 hypothetical protein [Photorhabdus laumondii]CAE15699.1 unnamed protein product [Photorhabdus laumondii subsp. laumondii TTO1]